MNDQIREKSQYLLKKINPYTKRIFRGNATTAIELREIHYVNSTNIISAFVNVHTYIEGLLFLEQR